MSSDGGSTIAPLTRVTMMDSEPPWNRGLPVSISCITEPSEKMSETWVSASFSACSGLR